MVFIVYDIDLDAQRVTIFERNILKTMYDFLALNTNEPIKIKTMPLPLTEGDLRVTVHPIPVNLQATAFTKTSKTRLL